MKINDIFMMINYTTNIILSTTKFLFI